MKQRDSLRVLIVDDEKPARQKVRRFLSIAQGIEAIFEAADGLKALEIISVESPDVVFLDVQMPGLDGFGVAEALDDESRPQIVFVTAFDQYAIKAFDVHAVDYLLKPFDAARFAKAIARVADAHEAGAARRDGARLKRLLADVHAQRTDRPDRLLVQAGERMMLLPVDRIDRIEAMRNYVKIHVGKDTFRLRGAIERLGDRLDPTRFVQVNRSALVNVARIRELRPWSHGDMVVILTDGTQVRLSRRYRDRLKPFAP